MSESLTVVEFHTAVSCSMSTEPDRSDADADADEAEQCSDVIGFEDYRSGSVYPIVKVLTRVGECARGRARHSGCLRVRPIGNCRTLSG